MVRKRRQEKQYFKYECTITGKTVVTTKEAKKPEDLVSVEAYYQLNPEKDDRPIGVKARLGVLKEEQPNENSKEEDKDDN